MTRRTTLLERMRHSPQSDWTIEQVRSVCSERGFSFRWGKGSHATAHAPGAREILTIPARRPIKPVDIRMLVSYCDRHGAGHDPSV